MKSPSVQRGWPEEYAVARRAIMGSTQEFVAEVLQKVQLDDPNGPFQPGKTRTLGKGDGQDRARSSAGVIHRSAIEFNRAASICTREDPVPPIDRCLGPAVWRQPRDNPRI